MGNYNNKFKGNQNNGYQNNGYQGNQQQAQAVKHSGCKSTKYYPTTGPNKGVEQILTSGWRLSKGELISVRAVTTSKSRLSEKGWLGSIAVTFTNTKTGVMQFHWGTMQSSTGKVVIDKVAVVMNPKAKNGGYCGTYIKS